MNKIQPIKIPWDKSESNPIEDIDMLIDAHEGERKEKRYFGLVPKSFWEATDANKTD